MMKARQVVFLVFSFGFMVLMLYYFTQGAPQFWLRPFLKNGRALSSGRLGMMEGAIFTGFYAICCLMVCALTRRKVKKNVARVANLAGIWLCGLGILVAIPPALNMVFWPFQAFSAIPFILAVCMIAVGVINIIFLPVRKKPQRKPVSPEIQDDIV